MADLERYAYWLEEREAIEEGKFTPTRDLPYLLPRDDPDDRPKDGFWRIMSAKTKPDYPVAIWANGHVCFKVGRKNELHIPSAEWDQFQAWGWMKCAAVSEEDYSVALGTGRWPDGKPSRQLTIEEELRLPRDGSNDPTDILAQMIDETVKAAESLTVGTQDTADEAAALIQRLADLYKYGDGKRTIEVEPLQAEVTKAKARWGFVEDAERTRVDLRKRMNAYLAEEQRKATERAKAANAAAAAAAVEAGAEAPAPVAAPRVTAGASTRRSTTVKMVWTGEVVDAVAAVAYLLEKKDTDLLNLLDSKAKGMARALKSTAPMPGVVGKQVAQL